MFQKLLKKLAQALDKAKIPYMIIGGQAVLLYGTPRLTRDIDITLGLDVDELDKIKQVCKKIGFKALTKEPENFTRDTNVLPVEDLATNIRVDFIFSFTSYEAQAIRRATKFDIGGYRVKFASCEDVIIHKMFAGRAIDIEDVKNIIIKNKKKLDVRYIRKWLTEFSSLDSAHDSLAQFNSVLRA